MLNFTDPAAALDFIGKAIDLARAKRVAQFKLEGIGAFNLLPNLVSAQKPAPHPDDIDALAEAAAKRKTPEEIEASLNEQWGVDPPSVTFKGS